MSAPARDKRGEGSKKGELEFPFLFAKKEKKLSLSHILRARQSMIIWPQLSVSRFEYITHATYSSDGVRQLFFLGWEESCRCRPGQISE